MRVTLGVVVLCQGAAGKRPVTAHEPECGIAPDQEYPDIGVLTSGEYDCGGRSDGWHVVNPVAKTSG
jgi:hypothetical protein